MRHRVLVLVLAALAATTMSLTVGTALARDTQTYVSTVVAKQYFASPGNGMFRGLATDIPTDGDPGLSGKLDTRITYSGGAPGPGVENTVTGGAWILCSEFTTTNPDPLSPPECTADSAIALWGAVSRGTAEWDTEGTDATLPNEQVYAGVAKVEAVFAIKGGKVNGVSVKKGHGKFEGELDHLPLLEGNPPILKGTLELRF